MARHDRSARDVAIPFRREAMLDRLAAEADTGFDVVVVGGGITGVGVALDAVTRGLRTLLVERDDFASGTSSKSSKLAHGGLRYLQQGEVRLVYEALRERERLRRNAPHLVRVLPFMIPILGKPTGAGTSSAQTRSVVPRHIARALGSAMWMYDLTGGWRSGRLHRRLRAPATLAHMPTLPRDRVLASYVYYDAEVDDARLVLHVAQTAAAHGAVLVNRCRLVDVRHETGREKTGSTTEVVLDIDGAPTTVRTRAVVNATGVWADEVRALDEGADPGSLRPAKGVHLTVPWDKVRNDVAVVIPVPKDKRSLFLIPHGPLGDGTFRHCYVGTTDTDHDGPLDDPHCDADDVAYVIRALEANIDPAVSGGFTPADVTGVWAGLRPLVKSSGSGRTADLSRRHRVEVSAGGVVTVAGGKLTTYRAMAEDAVDAVVDLLGVSSRRTRCRTARLRLAGADREQRRRDLVAGDPTLATPLAPGAPHLRADVVIAVTDEMALTVDDVLTRRTPLRLFDRDAAIAAADDVAALMAPLLGWDEAERAAQAERFRAACRAEQVALQHSTRSAAT